jgi:hypothetical protein
MGIFQGSGDRAELRYTRLLNLEYPCSVLEKEERSRFVIKIQATEILKTVLRWPSRIIRAKENLLAAVGAQVVHEFLSRLRPQCLHLVSRFVRREQERWFVR